MKTPATARLYTRRLDEWTAYGEDGKNYLTQVEYEYEEFDNDGNLVAHGSEDIQPMFKIEKAHDAHPLLVKGMNGNRMYWAYTWNGKDFYPSGGRKFLCHGLKNIRGSKSIVEKALLKKYGCVEVQLR